MARTNPIIPRLDAISTSLRGRPFFYRFTLFTRLLLAAGFIPTGGVKLLGLRFAQITVETPIGAFFEAMYQTGAYWRFIGGGQVLAGLLLLFPATAHLGAALFLPIIANIFVITWALSFGTTSVITGLMLLAVLYLCAWDYARFRGLFTTAPPPPETGHISPRLDHVERLGFWIFGIGFFYCWFATRGGVPMAGVPAMGLAGLVGGLLALSRFLAVSWRRRRVGSSSP